MALGLMPAASLAQSTAPSHKHTDKGDITVTGQRSSSACTGQSSAQPIDYACLNGELKTAATAAQPAPSAADATAAQATTPSKIGTFSFSATSQRMGQNFGKSAEPYRPPAPQYATPVRGAGPR